MVDEAEAKAQALDEVLGHSPQSGRFVKRLGVCQELATLCQGAACHVPLALSPLICL